MLSKIDLEVVKQHLRITYDLEDELIMQYIEWAKSTVIESITTEDNVDLDYLDSNMQFQKAVVLLTGFYYENRTPLSEIKIGELPYTVLDSIQKLRGNPKVIKDDTNV